MNRKYLIALDMDGTLLTSKKKISFLTKKYLQKLDKKGHIVVLASGRPSRALYKYYKELKLHSPMICYNGAYVFDPNNKDFKERAFAFPRQVVKDIYKELGPSIIQNVMCETDKDIWLIKEDEHLGKFFWHDNMNIFYGDLNETLDKDPMTMIMQSKDHLHDDKIEEAVKKHHNLNVRFWSNSFYSEIYFEGTSKAAALEYIASFYNIKHENIIAFGDADNDIELLSFAGIGVAMKNGNDNVKKIAKMITKKDNDHNGIVSTLKQIIKG